jgi:hypothetical protein
VTTQATRSYDVTSSRAGSDGTLSRWNELDANGWALLPQLMTREQTRAFAAYYTDDSRFRSRIVMARHNFGRGEYQYFGYPLPPEIARLRSDLYRELAPLANRWGEALGSDTRYPDTHEEFLERCHLAGQTRPTPLLLKYATGDYNCLHQDLYGEIAFPIQVVILLSQPHEDFEGGELVLTEQRPRMQSRAQVVPLRQGDAAAFAVRERPVRGTRGVYRVNMRHGVSVITRGDRMTLGIIFHDAT